MATERIWRVGQWILNGLGVVGALVALGLIGWYVGMAVHVFPPHLPPPPSG